MWDKKFTYFFCHQHFFVKSLKINFHFKHFCNNSFLLNFALFLQELDLCIYLMSSLGIKMEVEDGTSATCVELISTLIEEDELNLPRQAMDVFCLWMRSPLLEVQLKPHHKPFYIRRYTYQICLSITVATLSVLTKPILCSK